MKAFEFIVRLVVTVLLCMAVVGAGACGIMAGNSSSSADWPWALVAFGFCAFLAWVTYMFWTRTGRAPSAPPDEPAGR